MRSIDLMTERWWWTSDLHFRHDHVRQWCGRPWPTAAEMDAGLVAKINSIVRPGDKLCILGDVVMGHGKAEFLREILPRINGDKIIVPGNHDRLKHFVDVPTVVEVAPEIHDYHLPLADRTVHLHMTHLPQLGRLASTAHDEHLYLCGHVHQAWTVHQNMVNVGVDVWGYAPISLTDILHLDDLWFPRALPAEWTWLHHLSFALAVEHDRRYREGHPPRIDAAL